MNSILKQYAKINDKQRINYAIQHKVLLNAKALQQGSYPSLSLETLLIVSLHDLQIDKKLNEEVGEYISLYNYENAKSDSRFNVNPSVFIFDNQNNQINFIDWLIQQTEILCDLHHTSTQHSLIIPIKCEISNKVISKMNCIECNNYVYCDNQVLVCSKPKTE